MLLRRAAWAGAAALAALVGVRCGCGERRAGSVDAGTIDAGGRDDGGGSDAGRDADAGEDPDDPGWVTVPDVQEPCIFERATRPEAVFPSPEWEPCPDLAGCRRVVHPDAWSPWVFPSYPKQEGAFGPEGGVFPAIGYGGEGAVYILARVDGPPIAAWQMRGSDGHKNIYCGLGPTATSTSTSAFMLTAGTIDGTEERSLFFGTYEEIGLLDRGFPLEGDPESISTSPSMVGLEYRGGNRIGLLRDDNVTWMDQLPDGLDGQVMSLASVGDHAFWSVWGSAARIAHGSIDEPTSLFLETEGGDVKGFATDGTDMAWVQAYDRDEVTRRYARVELWTAPYTERADDLAPRKVRDIPDHENNTLVGAGYWVHSLDEDGDLRTSRNATAFFDLRDGRRRVFHAPEEMFGGVGTTTALPLYVTATEALIAGEFREPGEGHRELWRVEMDSIPYEE